MRSAESPAGTAALQPFAEHDSGTAHLLAHLFCSINPTCFPQARRLLLPIRYTLNALQQFRIE